MGDEVKPEALSLTVRDQTGGELQFKVKASTKFGKIMTAYCSKKSIAQDSVRFIFEGLRLQEDQTPADLEMEDGDIIDCMIEQQGGAS